VLYLPLVAEQIFVGDLDENPGFVAFDADQLRSPPVTCRYS